VKEGCLPGIVEAEEEEFCVFIEKAKCSKHIPEPPATKEVSVCHYNLIEKKNKKKD